MKGYIALTSTSIRLEAIMKAPIAQSAFVRGAIAFDPGVTLFSASVSNASSGNASKGMLKRPATINFGMKSLGSLESNSNESFSTLMNPLIILFPRRVLEHRRQILPFSGQPQTLSELRDLREHKGFSGDLFSLPCQEARSGRHGLRNQTFQSASWAAQ